MENILIKNVWCKKEKVIVSLNLLSQPFSKTISKLSFIKYNKNINFFQYFFYYREIEFLYEENEEAAIAPTHFVERKMEYIHEDTSSAVHLNNNSHIAEYVDYIHEAGGTANSQNSSNECLVQKGNSFCLVESAVPTIYYSDIESRDVSEPSGKFTHYVEEKVMDYEDGGAEVQLNTISNKAEYVK